MSDFVSTARSSPSTAPQPTSAPPAAPRAPAAGLPLPLRPPPPRRPRRHALPLRERKACSRARRSGKRPLTPYRNEHGEAFFREACRKGWEGLIAKRADAPYTDSRSTRLAEVQVRRRAGAVIGGFTDPRARARTSGRCCSATTRTASCATRARSAPASTREMLDDLGGQVAKLARDARRSPTTGASAAHLGRARAGRRRSGSPSGPATGAAPSPLPGPARRQVRGRGRTRSSLALGLRRARGEEPPRARAVARPQQPYGVRKARAPPQGLARRMDEARAAQHRGAARRGSAARSARPAARRPSP